SLTRGVLDQRIRPALQQALPNLPDDALK
ncbi:MAG: hypothetical protein QOJ04_4032, partial [Caballeronia sp.]|nr:hypothetical protein [Caballeronia sp.]